MSIEEEERKAFENWALEHIGKVNWPEYPEYVLERNSNGEYAGTLIKGAWMGWEAGKGLGDTE